MNRRFFSKTALTGAAAAFVGTNVFAGKEELLNLSQKSFVCKFAPNVYKWTNLFPESCKDMPIIDRIKFYYDLGFRAFEDNEMSTRPVEVQKAMGKELERLGMEMGTFTAYSGFDDNYMTSNRKDRKSKPDKKEAIERTKKIVGEMMEVAKRCGSKYATIVPAHTDDSQYYSYQFENVAEHLQAAAPICEKAGVTMILEPLNFVKHPGLWLQKTSDAFALCKRVGSPNCKILFDVFHQQYTEGNLTNNIEASWDEIAYYHLGDVPNRTEPLSGEINYKTLVKFIHEKGYRGIYGMEHLLSEKSAAGEIKMLKAYREIDAA